MNNISILKFNGKWAFKSSNKDLNNFMIRKFRWIDSTNDFEEIEIKTYGQTSIITYIQSSLGTPVFFTKAFLGEQLVSYRNRFFVKSWFENVDPSEVPQGM